MPRGRPPKLLTAEVREQLLAAIRAGNYPKQAAEAAGIDRATFYRWLAKGREPAAPREYRDFCDALTRAQAEAEVHAVGIVRDAMPRDWRAAIVYLERRCEGWQRPGRVEHTAKDKRRSASSCPTTPEKLRMPSCAPSATTAAKDRRLQDGRAVPPARRPGRCGQA